MSEIDEWERTPTEKCLTCKRPLATHWRGRPCLLVPEEAEVLRASGDYICPTCGKTLYEHPRHVYHADREGGAVKGCNGRFYHL